MGFSLLKFRVRTAATTVDISHVIKCWWGFVRLSATEVFEILFIGFKQLLAQIDHCCHLVITGRLHPFADRNSSPSQSIAVHLV